VHCHINSRAVLNLADSPGATWNDAVAPYLEACKEKALGGHPLIITGSVLHKQFMDITSRDAPATGLVHAIGLVTVRQKGSPSLLNVSDWFYDADPRRASIQCSLLLCVLTSSRTQQWNLGLCQTLTTPSNCPRRKRHGEHMVRLREYLAGVFAVFLV
jgi:hypothetical protein